MSKRFFQSTSCSWSTEACAALTVSEVCTGLMDMDAPFAREQRDLLLFNVGRSGRMDLLNAAREVLGERAFGTCVKLLYGAARGGHLHLVSSQLRASPDMNVDAFEFVECALWSENVDLIRWLTEFTTFFTQPSVQYNMWATVVRTGNMTLLTMLHDHGCAVDKMARRALAKHIVTSGTPEMLSFLMSAHTLGQLVHTTDSLNRLYARAIRHPRHGTQFRDILDTHAARNFDYNLATQKWEKRQLIRR